MTMEEVATHEERKSVVKSRLASEKLLTYLRALGYPAITLETWRFPGKGETPFPKLKIRVEGHREHEAHTYYNLSCRFTADDPPLKLEWAVEQRLSQIREGLYDNVMLELGDSYNRAFIDAPFVLRGSPPGTTERLRNWLKTLAGTLNTGVCKPGFTLSALKLLNTPANQSSGNGYSTAAAPASMIPGVIAIPDQVRFSPAERAIIGVLQVATDANMEAEGANLLSQIDGVGVRMARMKSDADGFTGSSLESAIKSCSIKVAAESIQPNGSVTIWGIACPLTCSLVAKPRLADQLPAPRQEMENIGVEMLTLWEAAIAALAGLIAITSPVYPRLPSDRPRLSLLTPYTAEVHQESVTLLEREGFAVMHSMHLDLASAEDAAAVSPDYLQECVSALASQPGVEVVVVGSSFLRACTPGRISGWETDMRVPIVSSTQAFFWHLLRTAGVQDKLEGYGMLFQEL